MLPKLVIGDKIADIPIIQGGMGVGVSRSGLAGAGADVIICGAGLPVDLPELVKDSDCKIAPIVSSERACNIILKMWSHRYDRTADFIVVEGPEAGGHLGYSKEQLEHIEEYDFDEEIKKIICAKQKYENEYNVNIPVIVAGGVFTREDIKHMLEIGAQGVQIASRFVATNECDASQEYKNMYLNAKAGDICIVKSPVGMPGRAVRNRFIERVEKERQKIEKCYQCLEKCNPADVPYCITKALISAVRGDIDNGFIFCGSNVDRINKIVSVHDLIKELVM